MHTGCTFPTIQDQRSVRSGSSKAGSAPSYTAVAPTRRLHVFGYAYLTAAGQILGPFMWQIEFPIDKIASGGWHKSETLRLGSFLAPQAVPLGSHEQTSHAVGCRVSGGFRELPAVLAFKGL